MSGATYVTIAAGLRLAPLPNGEFVLTCDGRDGRGPRVAGFMARDVAGRPPALVGEFARKVLDLDDAQVQAVVAFLATGAVPAETPTDTPPAPAAARQPTLLGSGTSYF